MSQPMIDLPASPVSLATLRARYDALTRETPDWTSHSESDSHQEIAALQHHYHALRVVCSILLAILRQHYVQEKNTDTVLSFSLHEISDQLRQTARRSALLHAFLQEHDEEENSSGREDSVLSVQVQLVHPDNDQWDWKLPSEDMDEEPLADVLTMSKAELAAEEATLRKMANTPIPAASTTTTTTSSSSRRKRLSEEIKLEWNCKN